MSYYLFYECYTFATFLHSIRNILAGGVVSAVPIGEWRVERKRVETQVRCFVVEKTVF